MSKLGFRIVLAIGVLLSPAAAMAAEPDSSKIQPEITVSTTRVAKPAGDDLLSLVPRDCLFCVRVNNLDYTFGTLDQFLVGASPMPMGLSMMVRMQLAGLLGDANLTGINTQGNFAVFGVVSSEAAETGGVGNIFIAGLLPVTDYKQFISSNPNCSEPDEQGVSKITTTDMTGKSKTTLIKQVGGFALISSADNYDKLVRTAKSMAGEKTMGLASVLDSAEAQQAVKEPLWAYGNIQQVSKTFGPLLSTKLEEIKTAMKAAPSGEFGPMGDPTEIMNMYLGMLQTLMNETKSVSFTVKPSPQVCNMTVAVSAVPGTDMANMLVADASAGQEIELLEYLQDGAAMNVASKVNTPFWKKLTNKCLDLFASIAGESMPADDVTKMKTLAADSIGSLGGSMAFSFLVDEQSKPPFAFKYIIAVKDEKTFNRVTEESAELMNSGAFADFYKSFGMETGFSIKRGVDNYKGISIDSAKLVMKSTDPNSPQGQMINAIYADGFDYRWAIVDGWWVCTVGGDMDSEIRKLIDQVKAGGPKQLSSEIQAALAVLPAQAKTADLVGTYNFLRLFKMAAAFAPAPMPQTDIPTKSNIAFAGRLGNGTISVDIALPKEHLTEMMGAFMMMQQQMMQQTQQQNVWTCPMHQQVRQGQAGKCPVCGMDLLPAGSVTKPEL